MKLMESVKISQAITPAAGVAGATDLNGAVLDMDGFDGVLILVTFAAITAGAVTKVRVQQGETANLADAHDLENTNQDIADDDDNTVAYVEILNPRERYLRLVVDRATENAAVANAIYIQYKASRLPVPAQGTGIIGETFTDPAEGTA